MYGTTVDVGGSGGDGEKIEHEGQTSDERRFSSAPAPPSLPIPAELDDAVQSRRSRSSMKGFC
jgi:hypothetical protein